jgi:hypothetical protein
MTMQDNINIFRRIIRWNMDKPELQAFSPKIDNHRPVGIPIAIAPHYRQWRTDRFQIECNCRLADVAQMPDLIGACRKIENRLREFVMGISENKDFHPARKFQAPTSKFQTKSKTPSSKPALGFLNIDIWSLFGAWDLGFSASGALLALAPSINSRRVI